MKIFLDIFISFCSSGKVLTTSVKHTLRDCCIDIWKSALASITESNMYMVIIDFSFDQNPSLREDIEFILVEFILWHHILVFDIK